VILDGAHNPDAAAALASALAEMPCSGRRVLVIGLLTGRDPVRMLDAVDAQHFAEIITCTPPTARARPAGELADAARSRGWPAVAIDDIGNALDHAIEHASADDQIVVSGSIYLVADARAWLLARWT
jgi:dihydrofolate synthase/folylpolyglutamate synthase